MFICERESKILSFRSPGGAYAVIFSIDRPVAEWQVVSMSSVSGPILPPLLSRHRFVSSASQAKIYRGLEWKMIPLRPNPSGQSLNKAAARIPALHCVSQVDDRSHDRPVEAGPDRRDGAESSKSRTKIQGGGVHSGSGFF